MYSQAQFAYSQSIRERLVNGHSSETVLKKYLMNPELKAVKKEIGLKVDHGVVDDVVVNSAEVICYHQFTDNCVICHIHSTGSDREVEFNSKNPYSNSKFEDTYAREQWDDLVVFVKSIRGQWCIANLFYGGHFHLNGRNFNKAKELAKNGKYKEKHVDEN